MRIKRIFVGLLASAFAISAYATTLNPIQLLNPAGSAAGNAIVSAGPSTAPAWGPVTLSGITGTLAIANGGTGQITQGAALTALLGASTVPIANGGTGQTSAAAALTALGGLSTTTAASTYLTQANATSTYLTQANATSTYATITNLALKAPLASPTFTGTVNVAAITSSGLITPTSTIGIKATATNDNPQPGSMGEYAKGSATATSLTNNIGASCATLSLTPGDWDVTGIFQTSPAGTTTTSNINVGISTSSTTFITVATGINNIVAFPLNIAAGVAVSLSLPSTRISVASTTSVFVVAQVAFATSTMTCNGFLQARRAPH